MNISLSCLVPGWRACAKVLNRVAVAALLLVSGHAMADPPTATIGVTPNNTTIPAGPGGASVYVTGTVGSATSTVSQVRIYNGSTLLGTAFWTDTNAYGFGWNGVAPGTYTLTAQATDATGAVGTSSPMTITVVADVAPTVTITTPTAGASYVAGANGVTIYVFGAVSSTYSSVSQVQIYNGTTLLGNAYWQDTNQFGFGWDNVPPGTYTFTAKATDLIGLTTTSTPISVTVTSSSSPTVSVTQPANGTSYTVPASIPLSATVGGGGTVQSVEFYQGTTLIGAGVSQGNNVYAYSWASVPAGTYSITAKVTPVSGSAVTSSAVSITVNAATAQTGIFFVNTDHLGTPRLIENQSQQAVWKWDNAEAFGDSQPNQNPTGQGAFTYNQRFPGQYADSETNTNYNMARTFSPADGKFGESDPIGLEGGINTYSYVAGDPIRRSDSTGLQNPANAGKGSEPPPQQSGVCRPGIDDENPNCTEIEIKDPKPFPGFIQQCLQDLSRQIDRIFGGPKGPPKTVPLGGGGGTRSIGNSRSD